jgi:hypothetical protein
MMTRRPLRPSWSSPPFLLRNPFRKGTLIMMVYPGMLVDAAQKAGMKVPPDPDNYDKAEYPHFDYFCLLQLARPIKWGEHWNNAKILAEIPIEKLNKMTINQFVEQGFEYPI